MADELVQVSGGEQLVQLGRVLRTARDKTIVPTFRSEMNKGTKDLRKRAQQRIRAALPHRGGLDKWAGGLPGTSVKIDRDRASVKVTLAKRGHDLPAMDRGRLRHPTYGRPPWVTQEIRSGWWEAAIEPEAEPLQERLATAIDHAMQAAVDAGIKPAISG